MSAPAVILSGYLASIAMQGATTTDVVEAQSRLELGTEAVRAHAAHTLDAAIAGDGASDALRDVSGGATVALGALKLGGELHVLDTARDGRIGYAAYAGVEANVAGYVLAFAGGRVEAAGAASHQVVLEAARPRLASRVDVAARLFVTGAHVSAGGALDVHASRRLDFALEALAGTRSRALLAHGETLEALSGTQHEAVLARASYALGGGVVFAAASLRRDTFAGERDVYVVAALAGSATAF